MRTAVVIIVAALTGTLSTESFADQPLTPNVRVQTIVPTVGPEDRGGRLEPTAIGAIFSQWDLDRRNWDEPYDPTIGAAPRMGEERSKAGALIGFGVGFAVGFTTGMAAGDDFIMTANSKGVVMGLVTGLVGAGIGSMIGGLTNRDRWEVASLGSRLPKLGIETRGGDVRLALAY